MLKFLGPERYRSVIAKMRKECDLGEVLIEKRRGGVSFLYKILFI